MFSGIIERLGTIQDAALSYGSLTLTIGIGCGDLVNVECDVLAKYVEHLCKPSL